MDWSAEAWAFETERLRAIPWRARGEEALIEFLTAALSPVVTEQLPESWRVPPTAEEAPAWIAAREESGTLLLAVAKDDGQPLGIFMFFVQDSDGDPSEVRIGYVLAEQAWGKGYASELLRGFTALWDERRPKAMLLAGVGKNNAASRRVLEKAGFSEVGPQEEDSLEYERVS
jgi:RimJ/RimL family protein N-acetyltransferase